MDRTVLVVPNFLSLKCLQRICLSAGSLRKLGTPWLLNGECDFAPLRTANLSSVLFIIFENSVSEY